MTQEIWKDIQDYETLYAVSNFGRVKSYDRILRSKGGERTSKGKILKPQSNEHGYNCVMCDDPMPQDLLEELIRTRKALGIAVDGLEKMTWGCDSTDAEHLLKEIKEITALEQKDVK